MTSMTSTLRDQHCSAQPHKRTNSLGWAKSDCHTCASAGQKCDRARPRCGACIEGGITCGGYVQALNWERASSLLSTPQKRRQDFVHKSKDLQVKNSVGTTSNITIVQETGRIRKRGKHGRRKSSTPGIVMEVVSASSPKSLPSPLNDSTSTYLAKLRRATTPQISIPMPNFFSLPTETLRLLDFYQSRFSYTSLTFPVNSNPWHACLPVVHQIPWLRNAATALAERQRSHFRKSPEPLRILEQKTQALNGLASTIGTLDPETGITACLLLIALDYADSALSNWRVHLLGAARLLEAHGGLSVASHSRKIRSQIAMLVWYDLTSCLLSRCMPAFPRSYTKQLVAWENASEWTSLLLNGCPGELLLEIYDIALAASREEELEPGEAATIEMRIWDARFNTETTDPGVAAMSNCWRMGLLLYVSRVFHSQSNIEMLKTLSEEIIRLVIVMPGDAATQKQCLLPMILASCEITAPELRQIGIDYMERWEELTGIWIFGSALKLMRSVWTDRNAGNEQVWWGDKVPRNSSECYLFG